MINNALNLLAEILIYLIVFGILILLGILAIKLFIKKFAKTQSFSVDEVQLWVSNNSVKLKPNYIDRQIAYKLWVELNTRKIGRLIYYKDQLRKNH